MATSLPSIEAFLEHVSKSGIVEPLRFASYLEKLRTTEGMRVAKAKGKLRGKQLKLNPRQEAHLVSLYRQGEHSTAELADLFSVARSTVYRALQRDQLQGEARLRTIVDAAGTRQ